tara:strand:- start:41 stop:322 length:282 start_codon:yes stop_codon:yes gene_type:complete
MKLECDTFYFYPDFEFISTHQWNHSLNCYTHDIQEISRAIRIFGTRKEIDDAFETYCEASGLNIDECYDFTDKDKLKEYAKHYKNKALIINLK